MDLLEAVKQKEGCNSILCDICPLRTSEYFIRDYSSGIELGIKASVCEMLNFAEQVLNRLEEDPHNEEKIALFHKFKGGKE